MQVVVETAVEQTCAGGASLLDLLCLDLNELSELLLGLLVLDGTVGGAILYNLCVTLANTILGKLL